MIAPVGKLTNMECIGLRSNDNILDFPQGSQVDSKLAFLPEVSV